MCCGRTKTGCFSPKLFGKSKETFVCGQLSEQMERLDSIRIWPVRLAGFSTVIHEGKRACLCLGACLHLKEECKFITFSGVAPHVDIFSLG